MPPAQAIAVWLIGACTVAAILLRPWRVPEWVWAVCGAAAAALAATLPIPAVVQSVARGADVYAFLVGIMLLAELGRSEHVFDWIALRLLEAARGSAPLLLGLVYGTGAVVTALLSNDTTIVVLTPAVIAALRRTQLRALPYLYACAFVANAASFVLPISNPANLVLFGGRLPALVPWIGVFGLASVAAIVLTLVTVRWVCAADLRERVFYNDHEPPASRSTILAAALLLGAAAMLVFAASLGWNVGWTALAAAVAAMIVMGFAHRSSVHAMLAGTQWSIVPLVAGLFVLVTALDRSGAIDSIRLLLHQADGLGTEGRLYSGIVLTLASNLFNNLPVALAAGVAIASTHVHAQTVSAALVAIDLGPNLSVSGSLATLLWLTVLRREGITVKPMQFLAVGAIVLTPALLAALLLVR